MSDTGPQAGRVAAAAHSSSDAEGVQRVDPPCGAAASARRGGLALGTLLGAVFGAVAAQPVSDNSVLGHLAVGRLQVDQGLPASNPFLYSSTDFPVPSWWWSWTLGVIERVPGGAGLQLLALALAVALGLLVVRLAATAPAGDASGVDARGLLAVAGPAAAAAVVVLPFLNVRPHLVGFLLLGATVVVVLERHSPWWLLAVFVTWVNVHGSWLYGLAVVVALVTASAIDDRRLTRGDVLRVVASASGAVVGSALSPQRFVPLVLPWRQLGDPVEREALRAYDEWAALGPADPAAWALVALGLLAVVAALQRTRFATAALCIALVVLGVSSSRVAPISAIALVPFAGSALAGVGTVGIPTGPAARRVAAAGLLVCLGAVVGVVTGPSYRLDRYPVAAVDWLEPRGLATAPTRLASHDEVGNYLSWRFGAEANTFVDDRPSADALIAYRRLLRLENGWERSLAGAAPDVVVWRSASRLSAELDASPDWKLATEIDGYSVFCATAVVERCD